jgi:N-terminal half of MaoC dehydratase
MDFVFPIEGGHILAFSRAVGDLNRVYVDAEYAAGSELGGIIAPPTFAKASAHFEPAYPMRPVIGEPWFGSGRTPSGAARQTIRTGLAAGSRFEYYAPLRPGEHILVTKRPGKTWQKGGRRGGSLTFTESITEYRGSDGRLRVVVTATAVRPERLVGQ